METNFSSLPSVLQLNILTKLSWNDSENSRLVCARWLQMINYIKKPYLYITNKELLEMAMNSSYEVLGHLVIGHLQDPLPIYSSTRIMLPRTLGLFLVKGNSKENILNLLRYYIPTSCCEMLGFFSSSLSNIKPYHLSKKMEYNNLSSFGFIVILVLKQSRRRRHFNQSQDMKYSIQLRKHLKALAHFLRSVKFENLKNLIIIITAERKIDFDAQPLPANYVPLLNLRLDSFTDSLEVFLTEHKEQLKLLRIETPGLQWIDHLQHVMNVSWLDLTITKLDRTSGFNFTNDPVKSICAFKTLEVLIIALRGVGITDGIKAVKLLLKNNKDSLQDVEVFGLNETNELYLDWLYSHSNLTLTKLKLNLNSCTKASIKKAFSLNYKIETLKTLKIGWWVEDEESEDLGLKWIIQIAPNLERLGLRFDPIFKLSLRSIFRMIKCLKKLKCIQLCSEIFGEEDIIFAEGEDGEILSAEVEPWFLDNKKDQICGEWDVDKHYFKIWISQPLDESHYPQVPPQQ